MNDPVSTLKTLGLSEKEARLYLLLLRIGSSPASVIGKREGIPKSTARYLCQELVKKGLVTLSRKDGTFLYAPEHPDSIVSHLERRKQKIERQEEAARRIAGELRSMMQPGAAAPRIRFSEGAEGLMQTYYGILDDVESGAEILSYMRPLEGRRSHLPPEAQNIDHNTAFVPFTQARVEKHVRVRTIASPSPFADAMVARDRAELRETRITDALPVNGAPGEILIYADKVCFVTAESGVLFACVVQSETVSGLHRAAFEMAWSAAPRAAGG